MGFNSNHLCLADDLHTRQRLAVGTIVVEAPGADRVRRGDDAHQTLAQGIAPGAHGADVALAGMQPAHRVRMHETDNVAARFLSA
jgi:hypothetical protein